MLEPCLLSCAAISSRVEGKGQELQVVIPLFESRA